LTTAPVLRQADPSSPYILRTDAISYALGAALFQGEGANERPIEYASRLLKPPEKKQLNDRERSFGRRMVCSKIPWLSRRSPGRQHHRPPTVTVADVA
jgi:hypothetical protein